MDGLPIILTVIAALLAGAAIGKLWSDFRHLQQRMAELEAAQARHLPYRAAEAIEDATAALLAAKFRLDLNTDFLDNALAHLQKARAAKGTDGNLKTD